MSGGFYHYSQYKIQEIADELEQVIRKNGKTIPHQRHKIDQDKPFGYPDPHFDYEEGNNYSEEVIEEFKKGLKFLRIAYIYARRTDWLLSGDDGEDDFLERLKQELDVLEYEFKNKTYELKEDE